VIILKMIDVNNNPFNSNREEGNQTDCFAQSLWIALQLMAVLPFGLSRLALIRHRLTDSPSRRIYRHDFLLRYT
jgi:hypothetical protein